MGDLPPPGILRVEEAVPIDDPVALVGEEGEVRGPGSTLGDPVHHPPEIVRVVHRQGQNLRGLLQLPGKQFGQLHELLGAVRSPVAPVEDKDHIPPPTEIRKRDGVPLKRQEGEVRSRVPRLDPFDLGWR